MPIQITQQPLILNVSTTPASISQSGNAALTLSISSEQPLLEMQTVKPQIRIDQTQPFAEAGLKNIRAFMEDNIAYSREIVQGGVSRIVSQGNEFINIHTEVDPIPEQALNNAYDMFDKEFNYAAIPTTRPTITLEKGSVNYSLKRGSVTNNSSPQPVNLSYTPYQVQFSVSQYNSVSFRYEQPKFKFMV